MKHLTILILSLVMPIFLFGQIKVVNTTIPTTKGARYIEFELDKPLPKLANLLVLYHQDQGKAISLKDAYKLSNKEQILPISEDGLTYRVVFPHSSENNDFGYVHPGQNIHFSIVRIDNSVVVEWLIRNAEFLVPPSIKIAVLGDSFSSGEGNPHPDRDTNWQDGDMDIEDRILTDDDDEYTSGLWEDTQCHRSKYAGGHLAYLKLKEVYPELSFEFKNFACSGARIDVGLTEEYEGAQNDGRYAFLKPQTQQLQEWSEDVDMVIMSIGINDLGGNNGGMASIIEDAIIGSKLSDNTKEIIQGQLETIPNSFDSELANIGSNTSSKIFITEYPNIFRRNNGDLCGVNIRTDNGWEDGLLDCQCPPCSLREKFILLLNSNPTSLITAEDWGYLEGVVNSLNAAFFEKSYFQKNIFLNKLQYITRNQGICTNNRLFRRIGESVCHQGNITGGVHPNREQHEYYGELVYDYANKIVMPDYTESNLRTFSLSGRSFRTVENTARINGKTMKAYSDLVLRGEGNPIKLQTFDTKNIPDIFVTLFNSLNNQVGIESASKLEKIGSNYFVYQKDDIAWAAINCDDACSEISGISETFKNFAGHWEMELTLTNGKKIKITSLDRTAINLIRTRINSKKFKILCEIQSESEYKTTYFNKLLLFKGYGAQVIGKEFVVNQMKVDYSGLGTSVEHTSRTTESRLDDGSTISNIELEVSFTTCEIPIRDNGGLLLETVTPLLDCGNIDKYKEGIDCYIKDLNNANVRKYTQLRSCFSSDAFFSIYLNEYGQLPRSYTSDCATCFNISLDELVIEGQGRARWYIKSGNKSVSKPFVDRAHAEAVLRLLKELNIGRVCDYGLGYGLFTYTKKSTLLDAIQDDFQRVPEFASDINSKQTAVFREWLKNNRLNKNYVAIVNSGGKSREIPLRRLTENDWTNKSTKNQVPSIIYIGYKKGGRIYMANTPLEIGFPDPVAIYGLRYDGKIISRINNDKAVEISEVVIEHEGIVEDRIAFDKKIELKYEFIKNGKYTIYVEGLFNGKKRILSNRFDIPAKPYVELRANPNTGVVEVVRQEDFEVAKGILYVLEKDGKVIDKQQSNKNTFDFKIRDTGTYGIWIGQYFEGKLVQISNKEAFVKAKPNKKLPNPKMFEIVGSENIKIGSSVFSKTKKSGDNWNGSIYGKSLSSNNVSEFSLLIDNLNTKWAFGFAPSKDSISIEGMDIGFVISGQSVFGIDKNQNVLKEQILNIGDVLTIKQMNGKYELLLNEKTLVKAFSKVGNRNIPMIIMRTPEMIIKKAAIKIL